MAPPEADSFAGISGQAGAVDMLRRAASGGRIAHAYAFVGPPGSGRMRTARAFAGALVAPAGGGPAKRIERGVHPDVRVIHPTPPPDNPRGPLAIRMESVRALERIAALTPFEARWKVFIVEAADRMTAATPQAFLKTLEEPPAHTVIVLILDQLRSLPATVLSRCQIVRFAPVTAVDEVALLPAAAGEDATGRSAGWPRSRPTAPRPCSGAANRWAATGPWRSEWSRRGGSGTVTCSGLTPKATPSGWSSRAGRTP